MHLWSQDGLPILVPAQAKDIYGQTQSVDTIYLIQFVALYLKHIYSQVIQVYKNLDVQPDIKQ